MFRGASSSLMRDLFGEDSDDDETPSNPVEGSRENTIEGENSDDDEIPSNPVEGSRENTIEDTVAVETSVIEPGKQFASIDDLFDAYQEHARLKGFSVVKRTVDHRYGRIVCDRAGTSKAQKCSKRIDCKARLNAKKLDDGSWIVTSMMNEHNHEIDPVFSPLMPAHRHLSVNMKRQLEANDIAGLRPCKNVRLCEVQSGGPQNLGCLPKDCRNFIEERRRLRLGEGDAEAIGKMFARAQLKDRNFFYLMDIDSDGRLCNVLWIHPRSRAAYEEFHDVVSFDTTYLVNRYKMPFATVVGINHHGHSILLGCALVTHEDAESFRWVFSNWLQAMGDIHPTAIITDQCESIKIAIRELMPNTIHRFCVWHILFKLPQKFRGVADFHKCTGEFKGIVYDSLTIQTFETKWAEFLGKYGMENNEWLKNLYDEREKWVPVYLHHTFWAGMLSTQRSEGMHAYFDDFVHSRSTLKQFVEQYDIALGNKIQKELQADFQSKNKDMTCLTVFPWEVQFRKVYTHSIFKLVQQEIKRMFYCHVVPPTGDETPEDVGIEKFKILERCIMNNFFHKEFTYTVTWRPNGAYINCNCRKFEFKGILCCHIMEVLSHKNIQTVNERYVLRRWRKDLYRRHSSIFFAGSYPHMTEEYKKFQEVERYFQECTDAAMDSVDKMNFIKEKCIAMKNELQNWNPRTTDNVGTSVRNSQSSGVDVRGTTVLDPNVATPRGRPRENDYVSGPRGRRGSRGRGRGRGRGARGGSRGQGRGRGRGAMGGRDSGPTMEGINEDEYPFDLNDELFELQESFIF